MKGENGFTLIELLVVVAILGILFVIATHQYAIYRGQTFCSSVETDVKNTVTAEEAWFVTNQAYGAAPIRTSHGGVPNVIATTMNVTSTGTVVGSSTQCVRPGGSTFTFSQATGQYTWG